MFRKGRLINDKVENDRQVEQDGGKDGLPDEKQTQKPHDESQNKTTIQPQTLLGRKRVYRNRLANAQRQLAGKVNLSHRSNYSFLKTKRHRSRTYPFITRREHYRTGQENLALRKDNGI